MQGNGYVDGYDYPAAGCCKNQTHAKAAGNPLARPCLIEDPEPVLSRNLAHVLRRCDPLQRSNDIGITASVCGDGAASADHVQPDRDMVCPYSSYDVIHMFRPLIGRRNGKRGLWVLPPFGLYAPALS